MSQVTARASRHAGKQRSGRTSRRSRVLWFVPLFVLVIGVTGSIHSNTWQRERIGANIEERFVNETDVLVNSFGNLLSRYEAINPSIRDATFTVSPSTV